MVVLIWVLLSVHWSSVTVLQWRVLDVDVYRIEELDFQDVRYEGPG